MPSFLQSAVLLSVLTATAAAQRAIVQTIPDPANLTGERVSPQSPADTLPLNHGAPALQQLLNKLRTRASLMFIVAHPDDEDGGMLTFESRGAGARVAMLTLNRGEGGQNLMSADFNDALGLIRTQELLKEDRLMGVDQFFGTEVDFGFSKTKEETLAQWTYERVLYDAVRAIRLYRPLVLASTFVGGPTDGHGHHQVSGEICQEAFIAAADPTVFPEMNLPPWAPLAVYARVPFSRVGPDGMFDYATGKTIPTLFHNYVTGLDTHTEPTATVEIHEGDPATIAFGAHPGQPSLGMEGLTYVQWARRGLAFQKSQIGPNVRLAPSGRADSGYTLMGTRTACPNPQPSTANSPQPQGTPSLQARVSPNPAQNGASAPGACSLAPPPGLSQDSLFANIDTSVLAIATLAPDASPNLKLALSSNLAYLDKSVARAQQLFNPANIELTAPPLRDALRGLDLLLDIVESTRPEYLPATEKFNVLHELRIKRVQLNDALALAHHLTLTVAQPAPQLLTSASSFAATLTLHNDGANSMRIAATRLTVNLAAQGIGSAPNKPLEPRTSEEIPLRLPYLAGLEATRPYFTRPSLAQPFYDVTIPALRNAPATPAPINAFATLDDQGVRIELATIVTSSTPSTPAQPLIVVPPVSVSLNPAAAILPADSHTDKSLPLTVHLAGPGTTCEAANGAPPEGKLGFKLPGDASSNSWTLTPETQPFDPGCPGTAADLHFTLSPPPNPAPDATLEALAVARAASHNYTESYRPVGYPGLTTTEYYAPATLKAVAVEVITAPHLRVAYLPGTGDEVPAFLPNLGITPTLITPADLTPARLAAFDAVLLGVRAYAAHPELEGSGSQPLVDFAKSGGVVIAQYDSAGFNPASAPYPYTLPGDSAHNVVVEADPVTLLVPTAPLLNWPNKITSADFNGWIEERGHGFPATWSENYTALLETADPDQDPQRGGLLVAPVGKGAWIYCAYALYRQLPEAVPGAYRLLANLLSYPKNPQRPH